MTVLTMTLMTVRVATHLDPPMTVTVMPLLDTSMTVPTVLTVPTDSMMTVVTVVHPHRSDTATMTVVTVDYRVTMTVRRPMTVLTVLTVLTVEETAHVTVTIPDPHPVLLGSSMTVLTVTRMTVATVVNIVRRFLPGWTVDRPHHRDTTAMTVTVTVVTVDIGMSTMKVNVTVNVNVTVVMMTVAGRRPSTAVCSQVGPGFFKAGP
jgi:hypothetical protein